jgi:hypothetical protein
MDFKEIKSRYENLLLKKPNVVGVFTGYKEVKGERTDLLSLVCLVTEKVPVKDLKKEEVVPSELEGLPTDVVEVGEIVALGEKEVGRKSRLRPCPMGTSGGHFKVTAGTNGELLLDKLEEKLCIGTNNHVGADSNKAQIGDGYLQPAPYDGGQYPDDVIGRLLRFVPISFSGEESSCGFAKVWSDIYNIPAEIWGRKTRIKPVIKEAAPNLVDGALIEVEKEGVLPEILGIGVPKGVKEAVLDMKVQKSGRTTGHTKNGFVSGIDATVKVSYGEKTALFKEQIVISTPGFSAGGDSGSLILDKEGYAVGKLFAGSPRVTLANHIQKYLDLLQAELLTEENF